LSAHIDGLPDSVKPVCCLDAFSATGIQFIPVCFRRAMLVTVSHFTICDIFIINSSYRLSFGLIISCFCHVTFVPPPPAFSRFYL